MTLNSAVTNNLLLDSTHSADWINALDLHARYYPFSTTEIGVVAEANRYSEFTQADNVRASLGIMQMLARRKGQARCFLELRVDGRRYGSEGEILDNSTFSGTVAWTSDAGHSPSFRAGLRSHYVDYPNASYANNWQAEAYGGVNFTLFGSHSFDLEGGFALIGLKALDTPFGAVDPNNLQAYLIDTGLTTVYISPRWSHPLGARSGVSLQYTHRYPIRGRGLVLYGFSSGYLSPWASAFYGPEFTLKVRTLATSPLIMDMGVSYAHRYYLYILDDFSAPTAGVEWRSDDHGMAFLSTRLPMRFLANTKLEANVTLQFAINESSLAFYTFREAVASIGFTWIP